MKRKQESAVPSGALGIAMALSIAGCAATHEEHRAVEIFVAPPKIYDDSFLENQLTTAKQRLAGLQVFDQPTLTSHVGALQGGTLSQTGVSAQAVGAAAPSVTTVVPTVAQPADKSFIQTTQQGALTPSVPQVSAAGPALPNSFAVSSLDSLNEQVQLMYQITNWQLLLDGAISDRFQLNGAGTRRITVGFPINIDQPSKGSKNKVAEVEITVCGTKTDKKRFKPSLVNVLPLENTYNGVSVSSNSKSFGIGAIAGVFSVGVGVLDSKQQYFLIKHQDTVASQRAPAMDVDCSLSPDSSVASVDMVQVPSSGLATKATTDSIDRLTFAWDFFPQPGNPFVRGGARQTFAQLALPNDESICSTKVIARTGWRTLDTDTGAVGPIDLGPPQSWNLYSYDTTPYSFDLNATDVGAGQIRVRANGTFLAGLRVRVAGVALDSSSPGYIADRQHVQFTAPVAALLTGGAQLLGSDGVEHELQFWPSTVSPFSKRRCAPPEDTAVSTNDSKKSAVQPIERYQLCRKWVVPGDKDLLQGEEGDHTQIFNICQVRIEPYSDTSSRVRICMDWMSKEVRENYRARKKYYIEHEAGFKLVAMVGNKVYGLSDAPFASQSDYVEPRWIDVVASNDSLKASPQVIVQKIMMGPAYRSEIATQLHSFTVSGLTLLSSSSSAQRFAVSGSDLDSIGEVVVGVPDNDACPALSNEVPKMTALQDEGIKFDKVSSSFGILMVPASLLATTKQVVFTRGSYVVTVALPDDSKKSDKATLKLDDMNQAVATGTPKITITGTGLDQIDTIKLADQTLNVTWASDGKSVAVDLPAAATSSQGVRYLDVINIDKTVTHFKLKIASGT